MSSAIAAHDGGKPSMVFQAGRALANGPTADMGGAIIAAAGHPSERGLSPRETAEAP
jgi:hypothetical protein